MKVMGLPWTSRRASETGFHLKRYFLFLTNALWPRCGIALTGLCASGMARVQPTLTCISRSAIVQFLEAGPFRRSADKSMKEARMAILGAHMLFYTSQAEELRAMLRDVFGFKCVDAGEGWLIFALPPAELGVHPAGGPEDKSAGSHSISFMCDDLVGTMAQLKKRGVEFDGEPSDQGFGTTVMMTLPGGVKVMLYEPRHKTAIPWRTKKAISERRSVIRKRRGTK
jgi:hypothetical protein